MFPVKLCVFGVFVLFVEANRTVLLKTDDVFLSRKKRYLTFPMGSNFAWAWAGVTFVQEVQPSAVLLYSAMAVPFALPSDARWFRYHKLRKRTTFESDKLVSGFGGEPCVKLILCRLQDTNFPIGKSMVVDMLHATFTSNEVNLDIDRGDICDRENFLNCSFPILDLIISSMQEYS